MELIGIKTVTLTIKNLYCTYLFFYRTPKGLENVSKYPNLFEALIKNNRTRWTQENLEKLAGRNFIRVFRKVEEVKFIENLECFCFLR